MALRRVKGTLERALDKSLQDLVRGIRNHKDDQAKYIAECMEEIKLELKVDNMASKANAINKLIYLQMFGYDISWASFNIIEVMSSPKFNHKRIGYLAASQCFHEGTDVLMLSTNLIRKELNSPNMYEAGVAMSGLACFMTPDLARDLTNDIMNLMSSTKPYLRKKAVLLMYKVFLKFPEALRPAFPRLKEKLEDPDYGVQAAAVNVICELARKNPQNYLSLAPLLFKLLTSSSNNWVLIKIIKLFGAMTPLEPRLGKKLIEPLTNLIHSTSAMSLLYECITTVIAVLISISSGIPNHAASIQLCVQKLRILIEDSDQNLKYLGLLAMGNILKTHPKSVQAHKDLILNCLDDKDESIRLRALDLLYGMISRKTLMEIVRKLMIHMDKAEGSHYRDELLSKIIEICSQNNYQYIVNFEWYVSVLIELTRVEGSKNGQLIASQMLDVAIRVQSVRPFCVKQMAELLENCQAIVSRSKLTSMNEIMYAAAWICGEYAEHLPDAAGTLESMLNSSVLSLPCNIQGVFVQNVLKLYVHIVLKISKDTADDVDVSTDILDLTERIMDKLAMFVHSADLEVQERAVSIHQLLRHISKLQTKSGDNSISCLIAELSPLFAGELNPVAPKAQRKVKIPEGLDLEAWINEPPKARWSSDDDEENPDIGEDPLNENKVSSSKSSKRKQRKSKRKAKNPFGDSSLGIFGQEVTTATSAKVYEPTPEELETMRESRRREQEMNPNYLKTSSNTYPSSHQSSTTNTVNDDDDNGDLPAIQKLPGSSDIDRIIRSPDSQNKSSSKSLIGALISDSSSVSGSGGGSRPSDKYLVEYKQKIKEEEMKRYKEARSKKGQKKSKNTKVDEDEDLPIEIGVSKQFDMPEDAELSDDESRRHPGFAPEDPHRFLNISLDIPTASPSKKKPTTTTSSSKDNQENKTSKKKSKKETDDKKKKSHKKSEETVSVKKSSKSKKKKNDEDENVKLANETAVTNEPAVEEKTTKRSSANAIPNIDDLAFWLGDSVEQKKESSTQKPLPNKSTPSKEDSQHQSSLKSGEKIPPLSGVLGKLVSPPAKCTSERLVQLLTSGQLMHTHEAKLKSNQLSLPFTDGHNIQDISQLILHSANFSVVDKADSCVSLFAQTDKGQMLCLLLKRLKTNGLSIEAKSSDEKVAVNAVKAVRKLVKAADSA